MRQKAQVPDVLADRYASAEMTAIWSAEGKVRLEREFWIAVMEAQRALGADIPDAAIAAYARVKDKVDLESIRRRERRLRHDVKARIEEFCALAGHEHIHKGLTSRDLTENVEQLQVLRSLRLLRVKYAAGLHRLAGRVREFRDLMVAARTHNVPAQPTTVGRRLAMFGQEMLEAFGTLEEVIGRYPMRGIKGAVGTQVDQLNLLGDAVKVDELEARIRDFLGFRRVLRTVGQVYPRSLDMEVLGTLYQLGAGPSSLAKTLRLMAGLELLSEGFQEGQVGSSAMPHKMNARNCERINGFQVILNGYLNMVMGLAGDQWNEGDVSCSVVRRVALPGAMFAMDGMIDTLITVLRELTVFPAVMAAEGERYLPFLASTSLLMAAVKHGAGREAAHKAIQDHMLAVASEMRTRGHVERGLLDRLADDARLNLRRDELERILAADMSLTGTARVQADAFVDAASAIADRVPQARTYEPPELL